MLKRAQAFAVISAALMLQACVSGTPAYTPHSYFWLPVLGISDPGVMRVRTRLDIALARRGYVKGGTGIALALSTDAPRRDDASLGLGSYAGGYAYFAPAAAAPGTVMIEAYDAATLRLLWRASLPRGVIESDVELERALAAVLNAASPEAIAGGPPGNKPDARPTMHEANSGPGHDAI